MSKVGVRQVRCEEPAATVTSCDLAVAYAAKSTSRWMVTGLLLLFETVAQAKSVGNGWSIFRPSRWARYVGKVDPVASAISAGKVQLAETPPGAVPLPAVPAVPPVPV